MQKDSKKQIDWTITLVPLGIVVALSVLFSLCRSSLMQY